MNSRFLAKIGVVSLVASGTAYAVSDACDGFGVLDDAATTDSDMSLSGSVARDFYGRSVVVMDLNGDGEDDFVVGAPGDDTNGGGAGAVYVHYGPHSDSGPGSAADADVVMYGAGFADGVGFDVANARDLDNDGIDDLVIGSLPSYRAANPNGTAYVVLGSASLSGAVDLATEADAVITAAAPNSAEFGSVVAGVGDLNNDGFADLLVAEPKSSGGGEAHIFFGPVLGALLADADADANIRTDEAGSSFGIASDYVGDLDGDGVDDLVIGSPRHDVNGTNSGGVFMYSGATVGGTHWDYEADATFVGALYDRAGASVGYAGDLDGDSINDLWVGVKQQGSNKRGSVDLLLSGGAAFSGEVVIATETSTRFAGADANDLLGSSIDATGDFNGDGVVDIVMGGERADGAVLQTGCAFVMHGPLDGLGTVTMSDADAAICGTAYKDFAGSDVAVSSSNGDAFSEVLVGSWRSAGSDGTDRAGKVAVFMGGADTADEIPWYADTDSDGYGDPAVSVVSCTQPTGYVANDDDCGPTLSDVYPGAPESCSGADNNCDGFTGTADNDGDGFGACDECDDGDFNVNPSADEVCGDGVDNNCDGGIDDDAAIDALTYYPDADGDSYGNRDFGITACEDPGVFLVDTVTVGGDCDDANAAVSPGQFEVCDFVDNNCDDATDESTALDASLWFADSDADGHGNYFDAAYACTQPSGYVDNADDCDDTSDTVAPGETESCDTVDNNCDGTRYLGGVDDATDKSRFDAVGEVSDDRLGESLAFLGDQDEDGYDEMLFGAPGHDNAALGLQATGALYMNRGSATGEDSQDFASLRVDSSGRWDVKIEGTRPGAFFGSSVTSCDFNGDGIDDIVAGSYGARVPSFETGAAYVFYGPVADGDYEAEDADFIFKGGRQSDQAGMDVACGDLNGDSIDDLVMGAPGADGSGSDIGGAYVMFGGTSAADANINGADAYIMGAGDSSKFGIRTVVMDINGDGDNDIVVGSPRDLSLDEGSITIAYGPFSGGEASADVVFNGTSGGDGLGWDIDNGGDINGDGIDDLVAGSNNNAAYVIHGGSGLASTDINSAAAVIFAGLTNQRLGESVTGIGDMDNDGYSDFAVSAHRDDDGGNNAGAAIVIFGAADYDAYASNNVVQANEVEGLGRVEDGTTFPTYSASNLGYYEGGKILGGNDGDQFGRPVAGGGDFNGDGVPDFAAASTRYDSASGASDVGRVFVFPAGTHGVDNDVDPASLATWYADADCDTFLNDAGSTYDSCEFHVLTSIDLDTPANSYLCAEEQAGPTAPALDDCNDADATVYPGASEVNGDSVDSDCDGYDNVNTLPNVNVTLTPRRPTTSSTLTASVTSSDADGDTVTLSYAWTVGGAEVAGATTDTLESTYFGRGDVVVVTVTADDGRGEVVTDTSTVTVENAVPSITGCDVTPASGGIDIEWTAVAPGLTDDDQGDTPTVGYQWEMAFGPIWVDIVGETTDTLASCMDRNTSGSQYNCGVGNRLRALCTPSDGSDFGDSLESNVIVIENSLPVISACTINGGPSTSSQTTLTGIGSATDVDGDTVTIAYAWIINGEDSGVTGTVLDSSYTEPFDVIQLRCTPSDENAGSGSPVTSSSVNVSNSLPTAPVVDLTPNQPTSEDDLTVTIVTPSTDADGQSISYKYGWSQNSTPFANPTFPSSNTELLAGSTVRGDTWEVVVTPNDGFDDGPTDSDAVTILNSLPSVTAALLSPSADLKTNDTLMASGSGWYDADGDIEEYIPQWYVNDVAQSAQVNPMVLDNSLFSRGDVVRVSLTARDAFGTGNTVTSADLEVINTAPTAPTLAVQVVGSGSSTPGETDSLQCVDTVASADDDGDAVTYTYAWYKNGVTVAGATSDTLDSSNTAFRDVIYCTVLPNDGIEDGDLGTSPTVAVQDLDAPPAPVLNAADRYTNASTWNFTGTCVSGSTQCDSVILEGSDASSYTTSCSSNAFTFASVPFTAGSDVTFTARCEDSSANSSVPSNASTTELCSTVDPYEDSGGYGDDGSNPVDEWSALADDGSSVSVSANIINDDVEDWYVFRSTDDVAADNAALTDAYNFEIAFGAGASDYAFSVHVGSAAAAAECSGLGAYDNYSWDASGGTFVGAECAPDGTAGVPGIHTSRDRCGDFSNSYFVKVKREFNIDCQEYKLDVSNGTGTSAP